MNIFIFVMLAYGITNIIVFSSIFTGFRNFFTKYNPSFFGKLFTCMLCLGTWIGFILSASFIHLNLETPLTLYGVENTWLRIFLDGCFTSACVWIIHTLQEHFEK